MIFYRWHPEVAIRYLPIVAEVNKLGHPTVLEVGSGGIGIAPYLGRKVTGLDMEFTPPIHPFLETVIGSGTKIPFANKSFDVVISVDTLEHVKKWARKRMLAEMLRVARKEIIIAVPTGPDSEEQDRQLNVVYRKLHKKSYRFFDEQINLGLPSIEEIKLEMGDNTRIEENEPLALRNFLMNGWMKPGLLNKIFYWKILLLALPFFKLFNHRPYYRTIFYKSL